MIDCVLFDLDGTLIDTAPDFIRVLNQLRVEQGLPTLSETEIRKVVSGGSKQMIRLAFGGEPGEEHFDTLLSQFLAMYGDVLTPERCSSALFEGLNNVLAELLKLNIKWGIVTNKPERFSIQLIEVLGLQCPALVCPDHVKVSKPDPEPLFLACQQLGCDPARTIYVGDHERDIQAGLNAGMTTIIADWGYFDDPDPRTNWRAHLLAKNADHLLEIIKGL